MENKKRYNFVIVLCPSESRTIDNEYGYYELVEDKIEKGKLIYLGGRTRMQAAVDIASYVDNFIVVGGSKSKVDDMKNYLEQEIKDKVKKPNIIRIESDPDTLGNFWAVKNCLENILEDENNENKEIGLLTNFYHLPRVLRIAKDVLFTVRLIPIPAESVITRFSPEYFLYPEEFLLRIKKESDGLRDWGNERYKNQSKKKGWKSICHDQEVLNKFKNQKFMEEHIVYKDGKVTIKEIGKVAKDRHYLVVPTGSLSEEKGIEVQFDFFQDAVTNRLEKIKEEIKRDFEKKFGEVVGFRIAANFGDAGNCQKPHIHILPIAKNEKICPRLIKQNIIKIQPEIEEI